MPNSNSVVEAIKKVSSSVVSIVVTKEMPDDVRERIAPTSTPDGIPLPQVPHKEADLLPHEHERMQVGGGSGFIVSEDGYILTNKHVVRDVTAQYSVIMADDVVVPAKIISRDPINDIGVLKIEAEEDLPAAPLGDSTGLQLGETAIAIGNALGTFKNTVSVGVISGLSRFLSAHDGIGGGVSHLRGLVQTDAAINPGNSGGPLVDINGEAIGINVATVMGAENIGFAIPINAAKQDLEDIKKHGRIRKPFLGVRYLNVNKAVQERLSLPADHGAYVITEEAPGDEAVVPGSPAAQAGIQEKDLIVQFNGEKVTAEHTLQDILAECEVGQEAEAAFYRGEKKHTTTIKLVERDAV